MSLEVQLVSGRTVFLKELHQRSVYESVLEGVPTRTDNERFVIDLRAQFAKQFGLPVQLLAPLERILDQPATRRGQPALVPEVACAARFVSFTPARDSAMHASTLVVLWFQERFGLTEQDAFDRLKTIDWNQGATDFEW